jgi:hypothetical protein
MDSESAGAGRIRDRRRHRWRDGADFSAVYRGDRVPGLRRRAAAQQELI